MLGPSKAEKALTILIHRETTLKDMLSKLIDAYYKIIIDASSGYCNLEIDKISLSLAIFACQFGRYRFSRLPFGVVSVGNMFQRKINEIFKGLPNVYNKADDILTVGYDADGRDHNRTLRQVMKICHQNLN